MTDLTDPTSPLYGKIEFYGSQTGWVCPKCGSVYSPIMIECGRCNNRGVTTSTPGPR